MTAAWGRPLARFGLSRCVTVGIVGAGPPDC